jgi:hypothetical protein
VLANTSKYSPSDLEFCNTYPLMKRLLNLLCPLAVCRGLLGTCLTIAREEGPSALWKGLEPGVLRLTGPCLKRQYANHGADPAKLVPGHLVHGGSPC